jgi:hypothetical protein
MCATTQRTPRRPAWREGIDDPPECPCNGEELGRIPLLPDGGPNEVGEAFLCVECGALIPIDSDPEDEPDRLPDWRDDL